MCCNCGHINIEGGHVCVCACVALLPQQVLITHILFTHPLQQTLRISKDVEQKHLNHRVNINIFVILSLTLAPRAKEAAELRSQC